MKSIDDLKKLLFNNDEKSFKNYIKGYCLLQSRYYTIKILDDVYNDNNVNELKLEKEIQRIISKEYVIKKDFETIFNIKLLNNNELMPYFDMVIEELNNLYKDFKNFNAEINNYDNEITIKYILK